MNISSLAAFSFDTTFTIAVKNFLCFAALDNVRTSLQKTITEIVLPTLGGFFGPIVGTQIGTMCAIPVTLMIGDLMVTALKEMAYSINHLFRAIVYGEKNESTVCSFLRNMIIGVASFALGFFAKTYFCNYCMGPVSQALKIAVTFGAPFMGANLAVMLMAPALSVLAAPAVTFMLGDLIATMVSSASYFVLDETNRWLFES